ncbi:uncharacterized protein [Amphiura filiformis]|uniref:uncharacterized protein n=1 Tax=Amphiura filiformis TaxID=82378 RepID=UPI003B22160D
MPYSMMESLTEVFNLMQNELDQGNILNVSIWHSKAHNTTSNWWDAFIKHVERKFGADHGLPRKLPQPIVDEVCSLFERMEEEYGQGNGIILSDWQAEFETFAEEWWDTYSAKLQRESLFLRDDMPYSMMESLTEVFNLMQNELDQGNILNVSIWHSKAHNTTSDWWDALIKRVERRFGANHGLPRKLPQPIVDEVCSLFERMEEEYGQGNDIILSDWQAEFETFAEEWWDTYSAKLQR